MSTSFDMSLWVVQTGNDSLECSGCKRWTISTALCEYCDREVCDSCARDNFDNQGYRPRCKNCKKRGKKNPHLANKN
jgi:hypothetical protein